MLKGMFQSQDFSADLCDEEAGEGGSRPPHPLRRRHSATLPSTSNPGLFKNVFFAQLK